MLPGFSSEAIMLTNAVTIQKDILLEKARPGVPGQSLAIRKRRKVAPEKGALISSNGPPARIRPERPADVDLRLWNVAVEILLTVMDHLDEVSIQCLRNTNSYFLDSIPDRSHTFTPCAKSLMTARLETDMTTLPKEVVCMLCKIKLAQECFVPRSWKHVRIGLGVHYLGLMNCWPDERYCGDYVASTICDYPVSGHMQNGTRKIWIMRKELACLHSGSDVPSTDNSGTRCDGCLCDICPRTYLPRYERSGPRGLRGDWTRMAFSTNLVTNPPRLYICE